MKQVNIHDAKTHFSKLVEEVESGETIVIARAGKPVAQLVKFDERPAPPRLGGLEWTDWNTDALFTPEIEAEVRAMFEESEISPGETPL